MCYHVFFSLSHIFCTKCIFYTAFCVIIIFFYSYIFLYVFFFYSFQHKCIQNVIFLVQGRRDCLSLLVSTTDASNTLLTIRLYWTCMWLFVEIYLSIYLSPLHPLSLFQFLFFCWLCEICAVILNTGPSPPNTRNQCFMTDNVLPPTPT